MKGIFVKELEEIESLIDKGKYNVALEHIDSTSSQEAISAVEKTKCTIFRYRVYSELAKYAEAIKLGEKAFEESQKLNNKHLMFDSLVYFPYIYFIAGEYELRKEKVKLAGQILESIEDKDSSDYFLRKAIFLTMKSDSFEQAIENLEESIEISKKFGFDRILVDSYHTQACTYLWSGGITKSLKLNQQALGLAEEIDYYWGITSAMFSLAVTYLHKGELEQALDYFLQTKTLIEEGDDLYFIACLYLDLGYLYWLKRDLKSSLDYYKKSVSTFKEAKVVSTRHLPWTLFRMNLVLIEMEHYDEALKNIEQIELLFLMKDTPVFKLFYHLAKAVFLKTKTDDDCWNEATLLLEEVADEELVYLELNGLVIFHLCDVYLKKIQTSNDLDAFGKLKNRIQELAEMAREQKSVILLVQSLLLQSKLELIDLDIEKSQSLLGKAQSIAEEKGLTKLAKVVSNEFDILLDQLSTWEDMSTYLPSLEERFEFTHIENYLNKMMRDYIIHESIVDEEEAPVFFLLLNKEGVILFSEKFNEVSLEGELLGEILSFINRLNSRSMFPSETTKRIKHKNYTVAINAQEDIFLVYAFIGKSYHALQRINSLIKEFRTFTSGWQEFFGKLKNKEELSYSDRKQLSEYLEGVFF
ncbi:MAG: tetratricopeptide repeat protein [Candidatus Heimdallarchaeota archaeon]|nr:tetratricopeptide repeat protein [Candidatus Heimdallarchaeota archaeon]